ncbi:hypothetical protein [Streptomyces sp. NPDC052721]
MTFDVYAPPALSLLLSAVAPVLARRAAPAPPRACRPRPPR